MSNDAQSRNILAVSDSPSHVSSVIRSISNVLHIPRLKHGRDAVLKKGATCFSNHRTCWSRLSGVVAIAHDAAATHTEHFYPNYRSARLETKVTCWKIELFRYGSTAVASIKHKNITAAHKVFNISILETQKEKNAISSWNKESWREKALCFIGLINVVGESARNYSEFGTNRKESTTLS